jgi:hypothetical protein
MYKIYGTYQGNRELIDSTDTKADAEYLAAEYQLAYGNQWTITIKKERS